MKRKGFTLIELLIVVAIIGILAAIAVPNFLEAQVRAKVSRTKADLRSMTVAVEAYRIDNNYYPLDGAILHLGPTIYPAQNPSDVANRHVFAGPCLTTPIAYLTAQPHDVFISSWEKEEEAFYFYSNLRQASGWLRANMGMVPPLIQSRMNQWGEWMMHAAGPDRDRTDVGSLAGPVMLLGVYDPTNGTVSNGDILRTQSRPDWQ
ncbi:prepilin-type N-terminal cleavage/methylation domain-containing protein [Candidatus Sumerlaeota bacterium]|nr:prepilin-type N-terminal cleavage/methylation domain-containing protein [Candidatus Sumerlaeota bacterium]